jgi:hypothetical protein
MLKKCTLGVLGLVLASSGSARADFISDTLGAAGPGNYAILSIGQGDVHINGPGHSNGNVGIANGSFHLDNPQVLNGNVFLGSGASLANTGTINGTVSPNQDLTGAVNAARAASGTFAGLAPTLSVPGGAINGNTTINGGPGVNVVNISGLNLGNGQALTLNGPAGSNFVINDSGGLRLNSGSINLTGGLTPNNVVLNVTGNGDLHTSGGLNNESVINGILLAPNSNIGFSPGQINGELIAGGAIQLASGAGVDGVPPDAPEPASLVILGLGGIGLAAGFRKRWLK